MIRRIRDLLYDQGFTIVGARNKLQEVGGLEQAVADVDAPQVQQAHGSGSVVLAAADGARTAGQLPAVGDLQALRKELFEIFELLAESA